MSSFFRRFSVRALASSFVLILALSGNAVLAPAQTQLDKHARKIHHKLTKYRQGSYLHLVMADASDSYGALGAVTETSFTFTSADNNATASYRYDDVARINTDRERIGRGTEPHHFRHLVPIVVTAGAVAAGALTYVAVR